MKSVQGTLCHSNRSLFLEREQMLTCLKFPKAVPHVNILEWDNKMSGLFSLFVCLVASVPGCHSIQVAL